MSPAGEIELRPVRPDDLDVHFEQQRDPASTAMAGVPARDRAAFDAHWAKLAADPAVLLRSIVRDGEVVGSAMSFVRDGARDVGYWIGRGHWGQGIATAALGLLLAELDERPLRAVVAVGNGASARVLERHGFRRVREDVVRDTPVWIMELG